MSNKKKTEDLTNSKKRYIGVDVGTMNLVAAVSDGTDMEIKHLRNMYLDIDKDDTQIGDLANMDYVESEDTIYIISEDAYNMSNIWGQTTRRPMANGLISGEDIDAVDVLSLMIERLVGKGNGETLVYSVPAPSVDVVNDIVYHEGLIKRIFSDLGYNPISCNEAMAIVYSELSDDDLTALVISTGCGQQNIALSYKSAPVLTYSVARGGQWIDDSVARSLGITPNRVTVVKEKESMDLVNYRTGNKKERRIKEAIVYYYREAIRYSIQHIYKKLDQELGDTELPVSLPIVVAGGSSMVKGYMELFGEVVAEYEDFPFEIKDIRHASDPFTTVSEGLLIKCMELG